MRIIFQFIRFDCFRYISFNSLYCTPLHSISSYCILFHSMLCYAMLFYSIPCYPMLCYSMLIYCILLQCIQFNAMLYYCILFYPIPFHAILLHSILFYSTPYYSMQFYLIPFLCLLFPSIFIRSTCCATTDNTSSSMRLNSSKHAHAPHDAKPLKNYKTTIPLALFIYLSWLTGFPYLTMMKR